MGGDPLGDRDHKLHAGGRGLEDRVGGEARRHEDHRCVRLRLFGGLLPAVEHGNSLDVLPALAGRHTADDVRAVVAVVERVERTLFAGDPGDREARVLIDENAHQATAPALWAPAASATTFSAASFIVLAACTLGSAASCNSSASLHVVRAIEAHDEGNARFDVAEGGDQALGDLVAAGDAAEDVEQDRFDFVVGEDQLDGLLDLAGV